MLPEKGVPSAVSGTARRWCQDYAVGLEESSTGEVPRRENSVAITAECSWHHANKRASSNPGYTAGYIIQMMHERPCFICYVV